MYSPGDMVYGMNPEIDCADSDAGHDENSKYEDVAFATGSEVGVRGQHVPPHPRHGPTVVGGPIGLSGHPATAEAWCTDPSGVRGLEQSYLCAMGGGRSIVCVHTVQLSSLQIFTRGGSKRCSHFVSMATKTPEQRKEQDQKRHQAILDDITSKCDQAGNIRCMSHSSVRFPRLSIQQLHVLQDRDGWIQRRIQLEAGVTQIATSGTGRYCFWLLVIGVPLILSVTQGRPDSPN